MKFSYLKFTYIFCFVFLLFQHQTKASLQYYQDLSLEDFKKKYNISPPDQKKNHHQTLLQIALKQEKAVPNYILDKLEHTQLERKKTYSTDEEKIKELLKNPAIQRDPDNPNQYLIDHGRLTTLALPQRWLAEQRLLAQICDKAPQDQCLNLLKKALKICSVHHLFEEIHGWTVENYARNHNPQVIPFLQLYKKLHPKNIKTPANFAKNLYERVCQAFQSFMLDDQPDELNQLFKKDLNQDLCYFFQNQPRFDEDHYLLFHPLQNYILLLSLLKKANQTNHTTASKITFVDRIRNRDNDTIKKMLEGGYNPDTQNTEFDDLEYYGIFPIHAAIIEGNFTALKHLLNHNASLITTRFGHPNRNAAHFAIQVFFNHKDHLPRKPYLECLKLILEHDKTQINKLVPNTNKTLLEYAVVSSTKKEYIDPNFDLLSLLISFGADLNQQTAQGKSLLQLTQHTQHSQRIHQWLFNETILQGMSSDQ